MWFSGLPTPKIVPSASETGKKQYTNGSGSCRNRGLWRLDCWIVEDRQVWEIQQLNHQTFLRTKPICFAWLNVGMVVGAFLSRPVCRKAAPARANKLPVHTRIHIPRARRRHPRSGLRICLRPPNFSRGFAAARGRPDPPKSRIFLLNLPPPPLSVPPPCEGI